MPMMFAEQDADFDIVIVGAGPAGLSAASQAAARGNRYVLLEAQEHIAETIQQYQKRKHVMAEPAILPLRSGMRFAEGRREEILDAWEAGIAEQSLSVAFRRKVVAISRDTPNAALQVRCEDGSTYVTRTVILAIGVQGNPRRLGIPGEDSGVVQYTLVDPDEFQGETIIVVGAGDAGIENACALATHNTVHLLNRSEEFTRCKEGNRLLAEKMAKAGRLQVWHSASGTELAGPESGFPQTFAFMGAKGPSRLPCHRVIARLGAIPQRKLLEGFGVEFPNANPDAIPVLSESLESSVPGLFVVGALAGYPLIKQAMNQGHEVVEAINGTPLEPVDEPLLRERLAVWLDAESRWVDPGAADAGSIDVNATLTRLQEISPFLACLSRTQLRDLLLESRFRVHEEGSLITVKGDYASSFFTVVAGEAAAGANVIPTGGFFGELSLILGKPRTRSVLASRPAVVMESPRRAMLKLMASSDDAAHLIDRSFLRNALQQFLGRAVADEDVEFVLRNKMVLKRFNAGEVIFREGDEPDGLHIIRRGSVVVSRTVRGEQRIQAHLSSGEYFGEMALLSGASRTATVAATVRSETLVLEADFLRERLQGNQQLKRLLFTRAQAGGRRDALQDDRPGDTTSARSQFLMAQGAGEATNMLVIDESLCIQCDNCETACAETHGGVSRLRRERGPTFAYLHVVESCRHCEQPHCMKDCPPDAITRDARGEVYISDACIGCGNCEANCPYGAVEMVPRAPPKRGGGLGWLLFGLGKPPGRRAPEPDPGARKVAAKCDLCRGLGGGPRCVSSCPTGAARRASAGELFGDAR